MFNPMTRILLLLCCVLFLIPVTQPAQAQDYQPRFTDPGWQASYWNNRDLAGPPLLRRVDSQLNFDWGFGGPDGIFATDNFSARWERYIDVAPGTYRFTATADDGIRLWVDNELLIDQWTEHSAQRFSAEKRLQRGTHAIRVEYFEATGAAVVSVDWALTTAWPSPIYGWRGEYFNNTTLSGTPALVRDDREIDFRWGTGSPGYQIGRDDFSARWTRNLDLPAGTYRFTMTVDDGARLFINGRTLIDAWKDQPQTTYTEEIKLPGGAVTVQMEYYERREGATAQLRWQRIDDHQGPITEWRAEYYNNRSLSGSPAVVRNERTIDFNWGTGSPDLNRIDVDNFSARWLQTISFTPGNYRFTTTVDDGVRLYLNGRLLLESWREQAPTTYTSDIYLSGPVTIEMQYFEARGGATAQLRWQRVDQAPYPTPTPTPYYPPTPTPHYPPSHAVIVDNTDPGFVKGGSNSGWRTQSEGYGGSLLWSRNNDRVRPYYNWARWYPTLQPGRYEVFVYIPDRYTTTGNARYWVSHQGGLTLRVVSQSANGDRWVSLGTYYFQGTQKDYVSLADVTFEQRLSRLMAWDAMKWEAR